MENYDAVVIGAGSAGARAARLLAEGGLKTVVFEGVGAGGTCVLRGCVPKKLMKEAAKFASTVKHAKNQGWSIGDFSFNLKAFNAKKSSHLNRISGFYEGNMEKQGVTVVKKFASFKSNTVITDGEKDYSFKHAIIAVGSKPVMPNIEGIEHVLTSDGFFELQEIPQKTVVIGAGYIGLEFSCILNSLGSKVTTITRKGDFLSNFDQETVAYLKEKIEGNGVDFLEENVSKIVKTEDGFKVVLQNGEEIVADKVIGAIGRLPMIEELGLENTDIKFTKLAIEVDDNFKTNVENIFAVGDAVNKLNLTPVAIRHSVNVVNQILHGIEEKFDYSNIATALFSYPEFATVGLSQEQAEQQGYKVKTYKALFTPLKHIFTDNADKIFMKIVVNEESDLVLGMHLVGEDCAEIIQGFAVAMKKGLTKKDLDSNVPVHPISAEELLTLK